MIPINTKKLIASFISELYMDKISYIKVFEQLSEIENSDSLSSLYESFYDKHLNNSDIKKEDFVGNLVAISDNFPSSESGVTLDEKETYKDFMREYNKKDNHNFEKMIYPFFLFTKNLYYELVKKGAKKVFFFAREGQFMKKLFDLFVEKVPGPKIKSEYLYVSRASTFLGTLLPLEKENFDSLCIQYPNMSIETFLKNLNFTDKEIANIKKQCDFDLTSVINGIRSSSEFKSLLKMGDFIKIYDEKRLNARERFLEYLAQFDIEKEDIVHIVDVGWKGSIQTNIQKILSNKKVQGYYLGLVHYGSIIDYDQKTPVLFEYTNERISTNGYLYNGNRPFFEIFLDADHGSTVNYKKSANKILPVLNEQEKEKEMFEKHIRPIQNNMFDKYVKILEILKYSFYDNVVIEKKINEKFFLLNFKPTKSEAEEFNKFYHFENFGVMNYSEFKRNDKLKFIDKIKRYVRFHDFIRNDETWQYLKLYNADMKLGKIVLFVYKKHVMKKHGII